MRKRDLFINFPLLAIMFAIILSWNAIATENQTLINDAFKCLNEEIGNKSSLTLEQAIFASMVISSNTKIENTLNNENERGECWPRGNCQIKESSQVLLALQRRASDVTKVSKWIISKNTTPSELIWYLQVDIQDHSPAKCKIEYGAGSGEIEILEDMTLSRNTASDCLSISGRGYWLKIAPSCASKQFRVSCTKDFVTSLLYQKKDGDTVYVSSDSHKASSNSTTSETIKARCFANDGITCNYEGTLWAAFALNKIGKDIQIYLPYLIALYEDNTRYLPSAFLYSLISKNAGSDEFYNDLVQRQKRDGFWEITGSRYGKYYDSSVAMFGLGGKETTEANKLKDALSRERNSKGCWASVDPIRDTSFIIYSVWDKMTRGGGGGGGGRGSEPTCESSGEQSCEVRADCVGAGAEEVSGFLCPSGKICCSKEVVLRSCTQQNGKTCQEDEECAGSVVSSSDGSCCLGNCTEATHAAQNDTCTPSGGVCRSLCSSNEKKDQSKTCSTEGDICCVTQKNGGGVSWLLIVLLVILIVLVILAIVYRDKLKVWWYSRKGRASISPVIRPGVPPLSGESAGPQPGLRPSQRFVPPARSTQFRPVTKQSPTSARPQQKPTSQRDKDMEETLRKLREISG